MSNNTTSAVEVEGWRNFEVSFDNFERLPAERGEYIESAKFSCFGSHQWCLAVYPGGELFSPDGKVSIYLYHKSRGDIEVESSIMVKTSLNTSCWLRDMGKYLFPPAGSAADCLGEDDFDRIKIIANGLHKGALVVQVRMRQVVDTTRPAVVPGSDAFIPENPLCKIILGKFMNDESADIVFEVGDESGGKHGTRKSARTVSTFYAHRFILQECAPLLAPPSSDDNDEKEESITTIPITDVKPEIFHHVLYYVYGGKLSNEDIKANAREIIDAADRYGVVNLKLEAEAVFVKSTKITVNNMMDHLHYAVSKTCALLQEAVMDFVVENGADVLNGVSFDDIPGGSSLFVDLIAAVTRDKKENSPKKKDADGDKEDFNTMRVSDLRKRLHEKGLDIDGSRKAMIATLREHTV